MVETEGKPVDEGAHDGTPEGEDDKEGGKGIPGDDGAGECDTPLTGGGDGVSLPVDGKEGDGPNGDGDGVSSRGACSE